VSYKDYYEVLGVGREASAEDIQRAYRRLARQFHPDVSKEPYAEGRFMEIQEAHEVLKDPDKRRLYDKYGPQWKAVSEGRAQPRSSGSDFNADFGPFGYGSTIHDLRSMFEEVFHGGRPQARKAARPKAASAKDQETELELPLMDAYRGGAREVQFPDTASGEKRRLSVQVPPGVRDGQRIRLANQGANGADLYLVVRLLPDDGFRLQGDTILTTLRISPSEAALGTTAPLATLDGWVKVRVPAGSSTGRQIRLRSRGYPLRNGERGDLIAEVQVVVPSELTDEERALYAKLAEVSKFDPRAS
jgi:curved DNA-binding protein